MAIMTLNNGGKYLYSGTEIYGCGEIHSAGYWVRSNDLEKIMYKGKELPWSNGQGDERDIYFVPKGIEFVEHVTMDHKQHAHVYLRIKMACGLWADFERCYYDRDHYVTEEDASYGQEELSGTKRKCVHDLAVLEEDGWVELTPDLFEEKA